MKKYLILLSTILLAAGCQEEKTSDSAAENILKEFQAELPDLGTKATAFPTSGKISWEKGDEVVVDNGSDVATFVYNTSRGVFVTERNDFAIADSYTAIYPAEAYNKDSKPGKAEIVVPAAQEIYPNCVKGIIMRASAGKEAEFSFRSTMSVVKIDFPADKLPSDGAKDLKKIVFTTKGCPVAGQAVIGADGLVFGEGAENSVTFESTEKTVSAETPLFIAVPAQTYEGGFSLDFTFSDGSTFTLKTEEDVTAPAHEVSLVKLLTPWAAFSGGEGTEDSPYILNSVADFIEFMDKCSTSPEFLEKHYRQTSDIDLAGVWDFRPTGSADAPFKGTYDGDGHSIRGAIFNEPADGMPAGMFRFTDGATIKGLKLEGWALRSKSQYLGGFVGKAMNTVFENCTFAGTLHQSAKAPMEGHENVTDNANVGIIGGFAGMAEGCSFLSCVFDGQISATGKNIGGITGYARNSSINECRTTVTSEILTAYHCAGGMAGAMTRNSSVSKCSVEGKTASFDHCGGIVGYLQSGKVDNCVVSSSAMISGRQFNIGGVAGYVIPKGDETAAIDRCTVYADVTGQYSVGGIAGYIDCNDASGRAHITNCSYLGGTISATGTNDNKYALAGGLAGWMTNSSEIVMENCVAAPKFIKTAVQNAADADIKECVGGVGGLFGFCNNNKQTYVSNCYTTTLLDTFRHRHKTITGFPDYKIWGLAVGRNAYDLASSLQNYYNAEGGIQGIGPDQKNANITGLTSAQMTDGTLCSKLNEALESLKLAAETPMASWVAEPGQYPLLDCQIADPNPRPQSAKRVSVIGDSISSFAGYIPAGYNYHYPCADGSVTRVEQTYWHKLIYGLMKNAVLDVNMSYSGAAVANSDDAVKNRKDHWVNNSYVQRYIRLGGIGDPDIVIIHGGTNDWAHADNCPLYPGSIDCHDAPTPPSRILNEIYRKADAAETRSEIEALAHNDFCSAYVKLVRLIQEQYPEAKIVCIIGDYLSTGIERSIASIANHYGARCVNLLAVNGFNDQTYMPKHDFNGSSGCHPNAQAMTFIAEKIYNELGAWLEQ